MGRLSVRVVPGASRDEMALEGDVLRVRIAAPAVDNKANERLIRLVARRLAVARSDVAIKSGHTSRSKVLDVAGLSDEQLRARLSG